MIQNNMKSMDKHWLELCSGTWQASKIKASDFWGNMEDVRLIWMTETEERKEWEKTKEQI